MVSHLWIDAESSDDWFVRSRAAVMSGKEAIHRPPRGGAFSRMNWRSCDPARPRRWTSMDAPATTVDDAETWGSATCSGHGVP